MFSILLFLSLNTILLFYTDPGSGALVFQLILATLLGGLFYFRKLKDFIFRKSSATSDKKTLAESPVKSAK